MKETLKKIGHPNIPTPDEVDVTFIPVTVKAGRKFRGNCIVVESFLKSNGGYAGSGCRPLIHYQANRAIAEDGEIVDFNGMLPEEGEEESSDGKVSRWKVDDELKAWLWIEYLMNVAERCLRRCGHDSAWATNYLACIFGLKNSRFFENILLLAKKNRNSVDGQPVV